MTNVFLPTIMHQVDDDDPHMPLTEVGVLASSKRPDVSVAFVPHVCSVNYQTFTFFSLRLCKINSY